MSTLRQELIEAALQWEKAYGNAPQITSALSEYDAAALIGMTEAEYSKSMQGGTAIQKGFDFLHNGIRYQVKANRPSGKPGSKVTLVSKAKNYDWDMLIWVLYDRLYQIQEAWIWEASEYKSKFHDLARLSPDHYRQGKKLPLR